MKKYLFYSLICGCFLLPLTCSGEKWLSGPGGDWGVRVEPALRRAKARGKYLLVLKTGLDRDQSSRRMVEDIFDNRAVKRYTRDHFEMVCLDFPYRSRMPFRQAQYNRNMAARLGMPDTVPSMVIVNGNGIVIARRSGFVPLNSCLDYFKEIIGVKRYQGYFTSDQNSLFGPTRMWTKNLQFHNAASAGKKVLFLITGSDRPQDCFRLQNDVISSERFYHFAHKHFSSVESNGKKVFHLRYLDFPLKKLHTPNNWETTLRWLAKRNFSTSLPTLAVYDPVKDRVIAQHSGYLPLSKCLKFLKDALAGKIKQTPPAKKQAPPPRNTPLPRKAPVPPIPSVYQNKLRQILVTCTGWGHNNDTQFNNLTGQTNCQKRIYLHFSYSLPRTTKAQIFVKGENISFSGPSNYLEGRGFASRYLSSNVPAACRKIQFFVRFEGSEKTFLLKEIPCRFTWK